MIPAMELDPVNHYFKVGFSIDVTIFTVVDEKLKVLLIKRKEKESGMRYSLPGKLLFPDEITENEALKLAEDILGFKKFHFQQIRAFTNLDRHPLGRVITIAYMALVPYERIMFKPNEITDEIIFVEPDGLPDMPFDHTTIVENALETLKNSIRQYPLAFELVPEHFTITEVRTVFEAVFDKELDKRNFVKKIKKSNLIEPVNKLKQTNGMGRKARAHRFRKDLYNKQHLDSLSFSF